MLGINLDRASSAPLSRQIHDHICRLILEAHLAAGDPLPSTRELARSLGVSRNTVTEAYEMLWAEGYVAARQGSRYRVEEGIRLGASTVDAEDRPRSPAPVAKKFRHDFRTGVPDLDRFPFLAWERIRRSVLETIKPGEITYGDTRGYGPLRLAIAKWLLRSRGVAADPENIFIASGATHAMSLAVETLCVNGGSFAVENPCHVGMSRLLRLKRIPFAPVRVDEYGMRVEDIDAEGLVGVHVTPSHQFPLGHVMSAGRRARLISLARERGFCVVEDDYDSEFRYGGRPLAPLVSLDADRVVYVGTFSKTLFPALRIGYAIVPGRFHAAWLRLRRYTDVQNPVVEQVMLAEFLDRGKMDMHVRKMTKLYGRKREALLEAVAAVFGSDAEILGDRAGLHLAVRVRGARFGRELKDCCRDRGVLIMPCARYAVYTSEFDDVLLLGYGGIEERDIRSGVAVLGEAIASRAGGKGDSAG